MSNVYGERRVRSGLSLLALLIVVGQAPSARAGSRWTAEQARRWHAKEGWSVGSNYVPASAGNQIEMWSAATFDPRSIDRELRSANGLGFNTMRVFLHDLVWKEDPEGLYRRMDQFLAIADRHRIKVMFVFF